MFMESQYWPPDHMLAYQRSQLSQLLKHARENVPFYKTRLDPVFNRNGEIDWDRWQEIPIVKRHHLVDERESMLAAKLPPGHGTTQELFSSGSSGIPIVTSHNGLLGVVSWAALYRGMGWHRIDWSKNMVTWMGNNDLVARWPDGLENGSLAPPWIPSKLKGQFNSNTMVEFDNQLLPSGNFIHYKSFETMQPLGDTFLDNCFVLKNNTLPDCIAKDEETGLQLTIKADASYPYLQVYTPEHRKSIAIENLSSAPDAFNNGMGLIMAKPGEVHSFTTTYQLSLI